MQVRCVILQQLGPSSSTPGRLVPSTSATAILAPPCRRHVSASCRVRGGAVRTAGEGERGLLGRDRFATGYKRSSLALNPSPFSARRRALPSTCSLQDAGCPLLDPNLSNVARIVEFACNALLE
ncbi:hypothetical protein MSAN_01748400 [Mycena sanguinolenta]|uniref:Uncharacterized protein n=1 Tax=Mycena sanguinolenta TaxID=230812 RepID=A0A8H6XUT6_9AGAR|nr:hypothetical protein MSAN_01748400 [Mycena sanguinolenta]